MQQLIDTYKNFKNIWLKMGERSDTLLTHVWKLLWSSLEKTEKKSTANESHSAGWTLQFFIFYQDNLRSATICRPESGRCGSFFPFLNNLLPFHRSRFLFNITLDWLLFSPRSRNSLNQVYHIFSTNLLIMFELYYKRFKILI